MGAADGEKQRGEVLPRGGSSGGIERNSRSPGARNTVLLQRRGEHVQKENDRSVCSLFVRLINDRSIFQTHSIVKKVSNRKPQHGSA
jgi:hypothetical protein